MLTSTLAKHFLLKGHPRDCRRCRSEASQFCTGSLQGMASAKKAGVRLKEAVWVSAQMGRQWLPGSERKLVKEE